MKDKSDFELCEKRVRTAHHTTKNTLQNILSYLNVMYGDREQLGRKDIQKLISYVRSLNTIHDLILNLFEENGATEEQIPIDKLLYEVIDFSATREDVDNEIEIVGDLPATFVGHRRAMMLAVITNELLDNAIRYGEGKITVHVSSGKDGLTMLSIDNVSSNKTQSDVVPGPGLKLVELLSQAELKQKAEFSIKDGTFHAAFEL